MSGDALQTTQVPGVALTAIESWVRARIPGAPARTARQLGHPQFHCGTPPPAPDPSTRSRIVFLRWFRGFAGLQATGFRLQGQNELSRGGYPSDSNPPEACSLKPEAQPNLGCPCLTQWVPRPNLRKAFGGRH